MLDRYEGDYTKTSPWRAAPLQFGSLPFPLIFMPRVKNKTIEAQDLDTSHNPNSKKV